MATTRGPAVIDALVALMRATAGYRDPTATVAGALTAVHDGPTIGLTGDYQASGVQKWLSIGWPGDPSSPEDGWSTTQDVATSGNNTRDEKGTVRCRACAQTGETDPTPMSTLRLAALGVVADVELLLRSNPTLGIVAPRMFARLGEVSAVRQYIDGGPVVTADFTVLYDTRI